VVFLLLAIGTLALLGCAYVNYSRERSRLNLCQSRLLKLGMATGLADQTWGHLPAGTWGQAAAMPVNEWRDAANSGSWWRSNHVSALGLLAPFFDDLNLPYAVPTSGEFVNQEASHEALLRELRERGSQRIPSFLCPSDGVVVAEGNDTVNKQVPTGQRIDWAIATQPLSVDEDSPTDDDDMGVAWLAEQQWTSQPPGKLIAATNYLGNAGLSGGDCDDPNSRFAAYRGPLRSRSETRRSEIVDGQSVTMLFGESVGRMNNTGAERQVQFWWRGGLGIGRGAADRAQIWESAYYRDYPWLTGVAGGSPVGFSSQHPGGVGVVMVGGETLIVTREIHAPIWFAYCGMADTQESAELTAESKR
jgi:hypothetical protein